MRYEARVTGTVKGTPLTHVVVRYFDPDNAREPSLVEDFCMQLSDVASVADAWDEEGNATSWHDERRDVRAEMDANILKRWDLAVRERHSGDWTGDDSKPALRDGRAVPQGRRVIEVDDSDPAGVLARADVRELMVRR